MGSVKAAGPDEARQDAIKQILNLAGATALGGAGFRLGLGALRNANPRYAPPRAADPVVVDIPYPVRGQVPPVPLPGDTKRVPGPATPTLATKLAGLKDWFQNTKDWFQNTITPALPTYTSPMGNADAQTGEDVPLMGAGLLAAGVGGLAGGYHVADRVVRAAERRRAQSELDEARQEYQDAVVGRAKSIYVPTKAAADVAALLADEAPADPDLKRAKAALDRTFAALVGPEKAAAGDPTAGRAVSSLLWPGLWLDKTFPGAAGVNLALAGGAAGLGAYMGYRKARDPEAAQAVRAEIQKKDRANAATVPAPMIGRLVPVPAA